MFDVCRTSGWANTALSDAIVMSAASWYQNPPPIAQPFTAAITGFVRRQRCMSFSTPFLSRLCQSAR